AALWVAALRHVHLAVVGAEGLGGLQAPEVGRAVLVVGVVLVALAVDHHRLAVQVDAARRGHLRQLRHGTPPGINLVRSTGGEPYFVPRTPSVTPPNLASPRRRSGPLA